MLMVALAMVILLFESAYLGRLAVRNLRRRLLFFLPAIVGGIPSAFLYRGSQPEVVSKPLFGGIDFAGLFAFPRLSLLSGIRVAESPEYWGTYLPVAAIILVLIGVPVFASQRSRLFRVIGALALLCLVLTFNSFELPSSVVRALPMGVGLGCLPGSSRFFSFSS